MIAKLKYFGILEKWSSIFSKEERDCLEKVFHPFGEPEESENTIILSTSQTKFEFVSGMLNWLKQPEYYNLGKKMIKFVDSMKSDCTNIIDLHYYYQEKIQFYYKNREVQGDALKLAINSCIEQISISKETAKKMKEESRCKEEDFCLPIHVGYKQLAIICEKQENWESLLKICEEAKMQGWNDNWDKRIEKARKNIKNRKA